MTRYALSWLAYRLGDTLEAVGCPTFARGVDWAYERRDRAVEFLRAVLYWLACVLAAIAISLLLVSCASFDPPVYWIQNHAPVAITATIWSDDNPVCNSVEVWGCADRNTGIITISKKAPPALWACLLEHETLHLQGYSHRTDGRSLGGVWCNATTFMRVPT